MCIRDRDTFDRNFQFNVEHVSLAKKADCVMIAPVSYTHLVGSMPQEKEECDKEAKDAVKKNILAILKDKYGIEEEDFLSAELELSLIHI